MSLFSERFAASLADHGEAALRRIALEIAGAGLDAGEPGAALLRQVGLEGGTLVLPSRRFDLCDFDKVWVVGAGKATAPLAVALEGLLGERVSGGVVVVPEGCVPGGKSRLTWLEADHPVPEKRSFDAGRQLLELARGIGPHDLVLSVVTGGSSALAVVPRPGVSDTDKQETHRRLLASGADIREINTVRKHLSAIKGGRLAAAMRPACIVNFTVSDVAGDPVEYICDLTVQDKGCSRDAVRVLETYGLWGGAPERVRAVLLDEAGACLPDLAGIEIETVLLVTGETVCEAMVRHASRLRMRSTVLGTRLSAPADALGTVLAGLVTESVLRGQPFRPPVALVACGGESTVALADREAFGAGGPNQEVAVAAALGLDGCRGVVVLAMDTDGSDGGTSAAGGIVDGYSARAAAAVNFDVRGALTAHQSTAALGAMGDLVVTGRTQTNVNDLLVVIVGEPKEGPEVERGAN